MDSTPNNTQPPSAPTPSAPTSNVNIGLPPSSGQNSELYNQIAAQDMAAPTPLKPKSRSPLLILMTTVMRVTLWFDSIKRTHERAFNFLAMIWAIFIGIVYCCGILVLVFAIHNRLQLPIFLEDELRARNIQFESAEYGMDRVIVHNLKDKNDRYKASTLIVHSTFADLLQKRIRLVTVDGLTISMDTSSDFNIFKDIPQILSRIQNPTRGKLDLNIQALTIDNATFLFQAQSISLPISFSLTAMYGDPTQIILRSEIDNTSLQVKPTLTFSGSPQKNSEWVLSFSKGSITLPRSAPETLDGEIKINLKRDALDTVQADLKLGYGTIEKRITSNFKNKQDETLSVAITWEKNNLTEPDLSSNLAFNIDNMSLSNIGDLHISGPILITSKKLSLTDFGLSGLYAPIEADVQCTALERCVFSLKKQSTIKTQELWLQTQNDFIQVDKPLQFTLDAQEQLLTLQDMDPYILFQVPFKNFNLSGQNLATEDPLTIGADSLFISGSIADDTSNQTLNLEAQELTYQTPSLSFEKAILKATDFLQESAHIQMQAKNVKLPTLPLLSNPFDLTLNTIGTQTAAQLKFVNTPILAQINGQLSIPQKTFRGQIQTNAFELKDINIAPNMLWPELPAALSNMNGQAMLSGQLAWQSVYNITGPLNIALKDVAFNLNDTVVTGLNTVLTLDSIKPLVTKDTQHAFAKSIVNLLPFQNLDFTFQIDAQNIRLNQLSVWAANIPMSLPPAIIPVKNANTLMHLKNTQSIDLAKLQKDINLKNATISSGTANLTIPLEVTNGILSIPNATLKMQNTLIKSENNAYASFFDNNPNYYIRTGQAIMDKNNVVQLALSGLLLPPKKAKDIQKNDVQLPDSFFKTLPAQDVPEDIQQRLNTFFKR